MKRKSMKAANPAMEIRPTPMRLERRGKGLVAVAVPGRMPALTSGLVRKTLERSRQRS